MPTKDRRPRTAEDFDFSKWMVYGAELPLSNSDLNDLGRRFDLMLSSSFDQLWKERGDENAGREITLNANIDDLPWIVLDELTGLVACHGEEFSRCG